MKIYLAAFTAAGALLAGKANPVWADADNHFSGQEKDKIVEEVIITATPLGGSDLHLAQPVAILSGAELQNRVSSSIGETLSHEPGIGSTAFGAGASRPVIRGQGGSRVRILESGISSMDVSNLSPDHAVGIEPLAVTQIEVLKGPATLLYGSGASGGVVNIVTNRIAEALPEKPAAKFRLMYNDVSEERSGALSGDTGLGPFALHLDGSRRRTDDYEIPDFGSEEPEPGERRGTLANSDVETDSLNGGASYIGEHGYLGFSLGRYESDYGIPGEGARIELDQDRYDIKGQWDKPLEPVEKVKFQLGRVDYEHRELEPSGELGTVFKNDEYEGRIEAIHAPLGGWHGAIGAQFGYREFSAIGEEALTPPLKLESRGLFLVEERDLGDWHVEMGGRIERQEIDPEDETPGKSHNAYSISGGAVWQFAPAYSAALYLSRAQRAPSLEELYNHGPHEATATFEIGNINLDAETANNLDLTFRYDAEDWNWQVNLFYNRINDYVFGESVDSNSDGEADLVDDEGNLTDEEEALLLIQYAQQDAKFYGLEASSGKTLMVAPWGELDGHLSFDYVRAELKDGSNLPRITPMRLGAGLDYRHGNWSGILDIFHVFDQNDNAVLETDTGGYTLLEASLTRAFTIGKGNYEFSIRGRNLLDEEARVHTSFLKDVAPLPGRAIVLSLEASL